MMIKELIFEQNREFNLSSDHSKFLAFFLKYIYIHTPLTLKDLNLKQQIY